MNKCELARSHIKERRYLGVDLAVLYFGENGFPHENIEGSKNAVMHIQNCNECKSWLKKLIPEKDYNRQFRLKKYCCSVMFAAVEEPDEENIHIKMSSIRGEALWLLDQPHRKAGFVFFSYCPWCGTKLPSKPFV